MNERSLEFLCTYFTKRKQRVKIVSGVPKGSTFGPLLFNIYICNLFYETEYLLIANYDNVNTPFANTIPITICDPINYRA